MDIFVKDPTARLNFVVDWSAYLPPGDPISTYAWTIEENPNVAGLVKDGEAKTDTTTVIWVTEGQPGVRYRVIIDIVTAGGLRDRRSFYVRVAHR